MRRPSAKDFAPIGMIMNSWKSIGASEWAPPFMMFIMGTGSTFAFGPPMIPVKGRSQRGGGGLGRGERDAQDGVGPQVRLRLRAVERDHRRVDADLVAGVSAR